MVVYSKDEYTWYHKDNTKYIRTAICWDGSATVDTIPDDVKEYQLGEMDDRRYAIVLGTKNQRWFYDPKEGRTRVVNRR